MATLTLTVTEAQDGRTVRSLLRGELGLSGSCIGRLKRAETGLTVNGSRVFVNAILHAGDLLAADLSAGEQATDIAPVPMDLDIRFEDEHLLILNKSAPLAVIPSSLSPDEATLANGLRHYLGESFAFHPVNRLDRGTTGLMVVAKNGYIHDRLRQSLHSGDFFRQYLAVTVGVPEPREGSIHLPIGRADGSAIQREIRPDGQEAHSDYRVISTHGPFALVELTPRTGRTHQLRVHMAAIGCPLAGDWLYGTEDRELIPRPALHAAYLQLTHPVTGELIPISAPLPTDMENLLEYDNHARPNIS